MENKDQNFNVSFRERVHQVPYNVEYVLTVQGLEQEEMQQTVEDVLNLGQMSLCHI